MFLVNEETSLLNNSSCLDPSKVDTMEKSEGRSDESVIIPVQNLLSIYANLQ